MHVDLDRLIRLQQIDTFSENARRRIADHPMLVEALDSRLASATGALETARARVTGNQTARRGVETDLAYTAVLKEIEAAQTEARHLEDTILERMLEADDLSAHQKQAEAALFADKAEIASERKQLEEDTTRLERELEEATTGRERLVAGISPAALSTYEIVRARRGTAVVEVKGDYCSSCHVRLRPQAANELRRNDIIFQCECCNRILYYPPQAATSPDTATGAEW